LDFRGVETIGQAFADEVFRVYPRQHPSVHLVPINTSDQVLRMILRAVEDPTRWQERLRTRAEGEAGT
jgi:hypothetical protein